jgi:hypothetical protein
MSTGVYLVYIIAVGSLVGNAAATGSVLLADHYSIVITDEPLTLMLETIFFLVVALLIMVKLIDKVVRDRIKSNHEGRRKSNSRGKKGKRAGKKPA